MAALGQPKTGGRQLGTKNKPKPTTDAPAPDIAPATAAKFPGYRLARVDQLVGYEFNARVHSPAQIKLLAKLITEYGFTNPILTDGRKGIIAGHGRVLAAQSLGMDVVPTIELKHLTAAQRRAYVLADNQSAINGASWDMDLLSAELSELRDDGFDLSLTGFDGLELESLLGPTEGDTDPDDVPPVQAEVVSRLGDVWLLGRHRVACGDSTNPEHVVALMEGAEADLCFTSPPYAQQRDYKGATMPWDDLMRGVFGILPVTHGAQVLVNLGLVHRDGEWMPYWDGWIEWMRTTGWRRFGWYVWDHGAGMPGDWNGRLAPSHEFVFHFNREPVMVGKTVPTKGGVQHGPGFRKANGEAAATKTHHGRAVQAFKVSDSVLRFPRETGGTRAGIDHPAPFPVALVTEMLTAFCDRGDTVYEPFIGSGTQLIGAEQTERTCYGMELAPEYVDVACRRFAAFTGTQPTLDGDGRTFDEVAAARSIAQAAD